MVAVRLYVEGGGDSKALRTECRRGFKAFLDKSGLKGRMPRIIACGGRRQAYDDFCTNHAAPAQGEISVLLVDSEGPVSAKSPWEHLRNREGDGWTKPKSATDDHCHLMVQCMETWFLADRESLCKFFGQGFRENALPDNRDIQAIAKEDVLSALRGATRDCKTKDAYQKGAHSFALLAMVDPRKVTDAASWAKRLIDTLDRMTRER